jgi:hypothetical protein
MLRSMIAVALALALVSAAEARPRHHHRHHIGRHRHRVLAAAQEPGSTGDVRPSACAGIAWCGCWLRLRYGLSDVRLNAARAWATIGRDAGGPAVGVVAVWAHHVGEIVGVPGPGRIILRSGNDGGAVRVRERSTRGIIAYRQL